MGRTRVFQPTVHVIVVILFAPQHAGQRLAHNPGSVGIEAWRHESRIELVGLVPPGCSIRSNRPPTDRRAAVRLPLVGSSVRRTSLSLSRTLRTVPRARSNGNARPISCPSLRAHGVLTTVNDVVVDAVLDVRSAIGLAENPLGVRLVFGEQQSA